MSIWTDRCMHGSMKSGSALLNVKLWVHRSSGVRGGIVVKALRYKPAGRGFDSWWCHWNFSVTWSLRSHYGPGVGSASNRNEYHVYFLGVKAAGARGWQPHHHPVPLSWNLGTLTSWNPLGHSRPVNGTPLPFLFVFYWMMLSGRLYICSIVGDWMIWSNQLTRLWSLTFCGGREENYGNMKDGVCPIQYVNWALTKYIW